MCGHFPAKTSVLEHSTDLQQVCTCDEGVRLTNGGGEVCTSDGGGRLTKGGGRGDKTTVWADAIVRNTTAEKLLCTVQPMHL